MHVMSRSQGRRRVDLLLLWPCCVCSLVLILQHASQSWGNGTPAYWLAVGVCVAVNLALLVVTLWPMRLRFALRWLDARTRALGALTAATCLVLTALSWSPQLSLITCAGAPYVVWALRAWATRAERQYHLLLLGWGVAIALAVMQRVGLTLAVPWPFVSPDTGTYLGGVYGILTGEATTFQISEIRTPTFPLMVLVLLGITRSMLGFVVALHLISVVTWIWAGRAVGRLLGSWLGVMVFAGLALNQQMLVYEHMLGSEAAFSLFLTVTCVLLLRGLLEPPMGWKLAAGIGLALALTLLARPSGIVVAPVVGLVMLLRAERRTWLAFGLALGIPLLAWCTQNARQHGFFGLTRHTPAVLYGILAHETVFESDLHPQIKAEMRPWIEEHNAKNPSYNPDINYLLYVGPLANSPTLDALPHDEQLQVIQAIAMEALWTHPDRFIERACYQHYLYVAWSIARPPPFWDYLAEWRDNFWTGDPRSFAWARTDLRGHDFAEARGAYELLVYQPGGLLSEFYVHIFEHPVLALGLFAWGVWRWLRGDPWGVAAVAFSCVTLSQVVVICVMQTPLARYYLAGISGTVIASALCLSRVFYRRAPRAPARQG